MASPEGPAATVVDATRSNPRFQFSICRMHVNPIVGHAKIGSDDEDGETSCESVASPPSLTQATLVFSVEPSCGRARHVNGATGNMPVPRMFHSFISKLISLKPRLPSKKKASPIKPLCLPLQLPLIRQAPLSRLHCRQEHRQEHRQKQSPPACLPRDKSPREQHLPPPPSRRRTPGRGFNPAVSLVAKTQIAFCEKKPYIEAGKKAIAVLMRDQFSVQLWSPPIQEALAAPCCKVTMVMDQLQRYPRTRAFRLGRDASLVLTEPNAGGKSVVSEALSMEYMHQLFGAVDVVTEMQIEYWSPNWKKVDYLCTIYAERIAVSVTRAMKFKAWEAFTLDDARTLLRKKLFGLVVAKTGVSESQRYTKSILHIWCQSKAIADTIALSYKAIVAELEIEDNVILMATVAHEDGIYDNNMTLVQAAA
ncbi:Aste57867_1399 [Aphanomyces stellatus]|uniref:Aste57867_1399 protein n=1 Tax=Aphanomyces stellatus TaxID=120398 RepID=A0A485K5I8_9STRA|nr:hypothetical protein As57867_001398 [Aphanomyces stellatus]VFT78616.1 Aste57867_1399 [Aphanomyces stellatus]